MANVNQAQLLQLQEFVVLCKKHPNIMHIPQLKFFKEFLVSLGANIPEAQPETAEPDTAEPESPKPNTSSESNTKDPESLSSDSEIEKDESSEESEIDLDNSLVIEPDSDEPHPVGDETLEVTEEMMDQSSEKRCEAQEALSEGKLDEAIKLFTESILKNPQSAALYAKRAGVLLKQKKPVAAIRDCDKALELNPDQALAFKFRGRAYSLLGKWEEAALDLANAQKIDYSDDANEWLKEVMPNAKKIQEHRRKYERKREQKLIKEREERIRQAREARERAAKEQQENEGGFNDFGGPDPSEMKAKFESFLKSPDVAEACKDPEVAAALQDIMTNPTNIMKYTSNEKVMALLSKMV